MSSKDTKLYGVVRTKKLRSYENAASTNSLAFNSALSSLISSSSSSGSKDTTVSHGRARPVRDREDIFTAHNKGTKKRAATDIAADREAEKNSLARMDNASWRRTKRKLEDKARLYAAMKRGDVEDTNEKHMVDFDRKWATNQDPDGPDGEDDDDDSADSGEEEMVEYMDEFGRTRKGTRAEAAREERRKQTAHANATEDDRFTARPTAPTNIIFGDTIQAAAFSLDAPAAQQMEELARKRDAQLTPPPETHYDANWEVRSKGTGFFQFSADEAERRAQMESLKRERAETERVRTDKEAAKSQGRERRRKDIEERRKLIQENRGKVRADRFLDSLGPEVLTSTTTGLDGESGEAGGTHR